MVWHLKADLELNYCDLMTCLSVAEPRSSISSEKMDESLFEQLLWQPGEEIDDEMGETAPETGDSHDSCASRKEAVAGRKYGSHE